MTAAAPAPRSSAAPGVADAEADSRSSPLVFEGAVRCGRRALAREVHVPSTSPPRSHPEALALAIARAARTPRPQSSWTASPLPDRQRFQLPGVGDWRHPPTWQHQPAAPSEDVAEPHSPRPPGPATQRSRCATEARAHLSARGRPTWTTGRSAASVAAHARLPQWLQQSTPAAAALSRLVHRGCLVVGRETLASTQEGRV